MKSLTREHIQAIEDCLNVADPCDDPDADDFVTEGYTPAYIHSLAMEGLSILKESPHWQAVASTEAEREDLTAHHTNVAQEEPVENWRLPPHVIEEGEIILESSGDSAPLATEGEADENDPRWAQVTDDTIVWWHEDGKEPEANRWGDLHMLADRKTVTMHPDGSLHGGYPF